MFFYTDTADAPWTVVKADDKKRARLNCMQHFLSALPYAAKAPSIVSGPDPLLVGTSAQVIGRDEHIIGKAVHPRLKHAHSNKLKRSQSHGEGTGLSATCRFNA